MFGIGKGKNESERRVGAKEKIATAQARARGASGDDITAKKEGKTDSGVIVMLIYILASALAFMLQIGPLKSQGLGIHTGIDFADRVLFGGGVPSVLGSPDLDQFAVPALRGLVILAASGILPLLTMGWIKFTGKPRTNPYVAFWGVAGGTFLLFFVVKDVVLGMLLGI